MSFEKVLLDKTEEKVKLALVAGKIQIVSTYEGKMGGVDVTAFVKSDTLIDWLCELIPGHFEDIPAQMLKDKLNSL